MKRIGVITRKELSAYFGSPMALIFVGAFLAVTLLAFFWVETFFARNIADVRPLFRWMPVLLLFLRKYLPGFPLGAVEKMRTHFPHQSAVSKLHRAVSGKFQLNHAPCRRRSEEQNMPRAAQGVFLHQ